MLEQFQNNPFVKGAIDGFKVLLKLKASEIARKQCNKCDEGKKETKFSLTDKITVDSTFSPDLYALGNSTFFMNSECDLSVDCESRTFEFKCLLGFNIKDEFTDPLDFGIDFGGTPYDITGAWVDTCTGSGSF